MLKLKLEDLLGKINMEQGFFITINGIPTFYDCADAFYESPESKYLYKKELVFITTQDTYLNILIRK